MEVQYPLVFFTLFLCLSSGIMAIEGYCLMRSRGTIRFHLACIVTSVVALAIGGFSSFLHLHHWERLFNGFGHLSSGITQELIGIVVTVVVLVLAFVLVRRSALAGEPGEVTLKSCMDKQASTPVWLGVVLLVVGVVMGFVCAHSYYMGARPAWSNVTLYLYYYSSEFLLGAAGIWMLAAACKQSDALANPLARLTLVAGIVSAVVIVACGAYYTTIDFSTVGIAFHTTDPTAPAADPSGTMSSPLSGDSAPLFWGGAVLLGSVVPAVLGAVAMKREKAKLPASVVALLCALAGGVAFRIVLYVVGVPFYVYF